MDFPGVDLVEELHHDEGVEDDGVVFGRGRVQRSVAAAVDVKDLLAWREGRRSQCLTIMESVTVGDDRLHPAPSPLRPTTPTSTIHP